MKINLAKIDFGPEGGGVQPTGTINITNNGNYDVTPFANADVNVPGAKPEYTLTETVTANGTYTYNAPEGGVYSGADITVSVSGGGASLAPLTDSITSNGSYSYIASDFGCDGFDQVDIAVSVPTGIQPSGTIAVSANGTYDVTNYANVDVSVSGGVSRDYSYMSGTITGLSDLGWDDESIGCAIDNMKHYTWQDSAYAVTSNNIALYGVVNTSNKRQYRDNTDMVYLPYFDTSGVTNWQGYFDSFKYIRGLPKLNMTGRQGTSLYGLYQNCKNLETISPLDTQNVTNMAQMFMGCKKLISIPPLDTSSVTNMEMMFHMCESLLTVPYLDTQNVTNMFNMFNGCASLRTIPLLDTQNVTDMNQMFFNCPKLETIPLLDTQNVTSMSGMFNMCILLRNIPLLDTQNVTDMGSMFNNCQSLTTIPSLDTQNVTNMDNMFATCVMLESVPALDTQNVTQMNYMFVGSGNTDNGLRINGIDFSSLTQAPEGFFSWGDADLAHIRKCIVNGKIDFDCSSASGFINCLTSIDYASVKSILQAMYRTTNNDPKKMVFNITVIDSQGELAQLVTDCGTKGWTVTGLTLISSYVTMNYTSSDGNPVHPDLVSSGGDFGSGVTYYTTTYENGVGTWYFNVGPTEIGQNIFEWQDRLTSVTIPATVTKIGYASFQGTGITSVTIPAAVTDINALAFDQCFNLQTVTMMGTPPALKNPGLEVYVPQGFTIRVPQAYLADYQNDSGWSTYASYLVGY